MSLISLASFFWASLALPSVPRASADGREGLPSWEQTPEERRWERADRVRALSSTTPYSLPRL